MKLFTRKKLLLSTLFLTTLSYGQALLPLKVTSDVYNSNAFIYKDKTSWGEYELTSGDGWGVTDLHFTNVPGTISLDFSRNKYGKSNSIQVLQSSDGVNWQENKIVDEGGSTSWKSVKAVLKKDTRFIRFYYKADYKFGDLWFKLAYWRNINIQKSVYHPISQLKLKLKPNASIDTSLLVKYSHPEGNLALSTNSSDIALNTTEIVSANQEGESKLHFTCSNNKRLTDHKLFIHSKDAGYKGNEDSTEVVILSDVELNRPVTTKPNSLLINWKELQGITDYRIEISKEGVIVKDTIIKDGYSLHSKGLIPDTQYAIRIQPLDQSGFYPFSDLFIAKTAPMPAFEQVTKEVINNTFSARWTISANEDFTSSASLKRVKTAEIVGSKGESPEQTFSVTNLLYGTFYDFELILHTPYEIPVHHQESFHTEIPMPALNEASEITENSFSLTWANQGENIKYIFTLLKDGLPVENYNNLELTVPEIRVSSLSPDQTYTYRVKSVSDEQIESPVAEGTAKTEMTVGIEKIENDGRIYRNGDLLFILSKTKQAFVKVYNLKGVLIYSSDIYQKTSIQLDEKEVVVVILNDGPEQITSKL